MFLLFWVSTFLKPKRFFGHFPKSGYFSWQPVGSIAENLTARPRDNTAERAREEEEKKGRERGGGSQMVREEGDKERERGRRREGRG